MTRQTIRTMKNVILLIVFLASFQMLTAQYTEIINSKRPGFSESPYGVGTNVYQFETGMFYNSNNNIDSVAYPKTLGGELFFRVGKFKENLEFNANVAYQRDEVKNPPGSNFYIKRNK